MLIHAGSVKDIYKEGAPGELLFRFSDRYSVFDWGQMPDAIPGKGAALARMGRIFFEEAAALGVATHYLGPGPDENSFRVKEISVPRGRMDVYRESPEWTLIPLEVIFRFGVPKGSSLLARSKDYFEGQEFKEPLLDFTTKLERLDRPLTHDEARALSGMNDREWSALAQTVLRVSRKARIRIWKQNAGWGARDHPRGLDRSG
ncbi:MAG: hypothetical protein EBX52_08835 [Proteobacteria bacterium]|nr:hypothetical protein [Pseudomonadota bacterium]